MKSNEILCMMIATLLLLGAFFQIDSKIWVIGISYAAGLIACAPIAYNCGKKGLFE